MQLGLADLCQVGMGIGGFTVGDGHDLHVQPPVQCSAHQTARSESLVIGVGTHDDYAPRGGPYESWQTCQYVEPFIGSIVGANTA